MILLLQITTVLKVINLLISSFCAKTMNDSKGCSNLTNRMSLVIKQTTQNLVQTPKAYVIVGDLTHPAFQDTFNSHVNLYGSSPQNGSFQLRVVLLYYFAVLPGRELSLVN